MEKLSDKIKQFPHTAGVYLMKDSNGKIIYVGKAIHLSNRVQSYFKKEADTRYQIRFLMKRVSDIDFLLCGNEKEALLLENSLIKKHKPKYNVHLKDDKSYLSIKLDGTHSFPRLTPTRHIKKDGSIYYGPYINADACRRILEFVYKNFMLRTCSNEEFKNRSRPCLEYQIKRCTAPCVGYVSKEDYARQLEPVLLFLEGKNSELNLMLSQKMTEASHKEEYEKAAFFRNLLQGMEVMNEKQRVVKHGGENRDIVYFYHEGEKGIFVVMKIRGGALLDTAFYPVPVVEEESIVMENFLDQFYLNTPFIPKEIIVSHDLSGGEQGEGTHQQAEGRHGGLPLLDILSEKAGYRVSLRLPKKGEKMELLELAENNARAQFRKIVQKEFQVEEALKNLQKELHLPTMPARMEAYDISNISGKKATASRVVFINGKPDKSFYRQYKIKFDEGPNDYAMMKEVLERRFTNDPDVPDLIIIDGGKGQLNIAIDVLKNVGAGSKPALGGRVWNPPLQHIPIIGVAKGKGPGARAKGLWKEKKEEEIYLPNRANPVILKRGSLELMLLQQIRDEAHRFAIKYHRKLRDTIQKKS